MNVAPPRILGVHAIPDDGGRWLASGLAVRVLMHPRLGFPIGPMAVAIQGLGEYPENDVVGIEGTGGGWLGNGEVDGTAYLRLIPPPTETRRPVSVRLAGFFDPGTRVSVVRWPFDPGEGIFAVSREPYTLWAPQVSCLRVDGRCQITSAVVSYANSEFAGGSVLAIGLPVGELGPNLRPLYVGTDPTGAEALARVRRGAPPQAGPHESAFGPAIDPADAEESRVKGLVFETSGGTSMADELDAVLATPHLDRRNAVPITDLIAPSPKPTVGERRRLEAILAAAGDPGIARWLGLAGTFDLPPGRRILAITVAGRWILPPAPWSEWLHRRADEPTIAQSLLQSAGVGNQFGGLFSGLASVYLVAQAWVDVDVRPDEPPSPGLEPNPAGVWIEKDGRDVVRLPIGFRRVVPLAQGAIVRTDSGDGVVLPRSPGDSSRIRPLLVRDGTGVDLVADPPRDDGRYAFVGWQADMFGRWSDASPDTSITSPPRPGLPAPEPQWLHDLAQAPPVDEAPYAQRLLVHVPVPRRRAGEPTISSVEASLGPSTDNAAAAQPGVELDVAGPALGRAGAASASLVVTFIGDDGSTRDSAPISIEFVDPRAPIPPPRDPVLHFATPPDASGLSGYAVPLPAADGIEGWRVFATTEARLAAAAVTDGLTPPDPALGRDERASRWLGQQGALKRARFDCLTPTPVSSGSFGGALPGTSPDILFLRPVPQRRGLEPAFESCPMIAVAAPRAASPSAPDLRLDLSVQPPVLRLSTSAGSVGSDHYRIRMTATAAADPRTAVVLTDGQLAGGEATIDVPTIRPFARAWVMAEVRAAAEAGIAPVPVRWSATSAPVEIHAVPTDPPTVPTPIVAAVGGAVQVTIHMPGIAMNPVPGPYTVRLYRRNDPAGPWSVVTTAEFVAAAAAISFVPDPGSAYQVVVVDPIGRPSTPEPLVIP